MARRFVLVAALVAAALAMPAAAALKKVSCPTGVTSTACATLDVPLDWADSKSDKITAFASVFNPNGNDPFNLDSISGVLWYLDFGCTGKDANDASISKWMVPLANNNNFAIIIPNFRGDGYSNPRLYCEADQAGAVDPPTVECAEQLKRKYQTSYLEKFSLDQAAQDLKALVDAAAPSKPNYLLGNGFGNAWAQRVLALYPTLFTRSMMLSYTNPMTYDFFVTSIGGRETVLRSVIDACAADGRCAAQLGNGGNLQSTFDRVMQLAEADLLPCNRLLTKYAPAAHETWRNVYARLLTAMVGPFTPFDAPGVEKLAFPLALLYRLQRCSAKDDVPVLTRAFDAVASNKPAAPQAANISSNDHSCYPSSVLRANVLLNELTRNDPAESVQYLLQAATVPADADYANGWNAFYQAFPRWREPTANANDAAKWFPDSKTTPRPVAKIAGTLDSVMPYPVALSTTLWDSSATVTSAAMTNMPGSLLDFRTTDGKKSVYCMVLSMESYFITNDTTARIDPCVNVPQLLDIFGTSADTQSARQTYFGNVDAWAFALPTGGTYVIPGVPFTTIAPPTAPPGHETTTHRPPDHTTTHAPGPGPAPAAPPAPEKHSHAGAIAGGIIGAIIGLAIIAFIVKKFCCAPSSPSGGSAFGGTYGAQVQYGGGGGGGWGGGGGGGGGGGLYQNYA